MKKKYRKYLFYSIGLIAVIIILIIGATGGYFYSLKDKINQPIIENAEKNIHTSFLLEVYDKIQQNYWDTLSEAELNNLYKLGSEKLIGGSHNPDPNNKQGLEVMLETILKDLDEDQKKEFSAKLSSIVLQNLQPLGRSGLYTTQDEQALQNKVQNVNPEKDLYQDLDINKDSSEKEITQAYQEKIAQAGLLAQDELDKVESAYQVLSDDNKKERYDTNGAEPTVYAQIIEPNIFHIHLQRFSPITFEEFQIETNKVIDENLDTLILDLRNNIGGSIDILPYFLGPFIGQDQYAYEFLHQGERTPFKTKIGWLNSLISYKKVIILINEQSQSTAELMAAALKRYNVGVLVGQTTRGWGTIERVFQLDNQISETEKYSMFLVHTLTLRDDNTPIEGNGVDPNVFTSASDWTQQLSTYFDNLNITKTVQQIWKTDPNTYY